MSQRLTIQDFLPYLHSRFRIQHSESHELELAIVTDHSCPGIEQFSLVFIGMVSPWLSQGTYTLTHPEMPECDLFLVPIGPDIAGMRYEAVFSRITRADDVQLSEAEVAG